MNPVLATSGIVWDPAVPAPFIVMLALLLGGTAAWTYLRTGPRLSAPRRIFLLALRLGAVALISLLLLQPAREESTPRRYPRRVALVALDTSRSMNEKDGEGQTSRIEAARRLLTAAGMADSSDLGEVRLFAFDDNARALDPAALPGLRAEGETTSFHRSLRTVLESLRATERCVGLFVFSDGHDFEAVSPARTAQFAKARQTPLHTVPVGRAQTFPDVAVHMSSAQPYTFIKQRARLQATLRITGCENQRIRVELAREGSVVRDQTLTAGTETELPVSFEVSEDTPGQYEYEIRATALPGEREIGNNRAFTYLNVTDAKIRVLLLEGQPHWDTTFLQRTLARNERVDLDAIFAVGSDGLHSSRSTPAAGPLHAPEQVEDFQGYPLIILGRDVEKILSPSALDAFAKAVSNGGATVVLARGQPGSHRVFDELAPAAWAEAASGPVRLVPGRGAGEVAPLEMLASAPGGADAIPALPVLRALETPKALTAIEALGEDADRHTTAPAILHRRHGAGQVLTVAVEGLWKWSLNARSDAANNIYDRFWNQLLLNLLSRSNAAPSARAQLNVSSANVALGEKVHFVLRQDREKPPVTPPPITIFRESQRLADVPLNTEPGAPPESSQASVIAEKAGRYRAEVVLPGGTVACRYAVFEERLETTDTTPDPAYLRRLAEAGGGHLLDATSLQETVGALRHAAAAEADAPPIIRRVSLWDRTGVFYCLAALLGADWFFRRRWGLT